MPNQKITQLPSTASTGTALLQDTDQLPLARSNSTYNVLGSNIKKSVFDSLSVTDTDTIDLSVNTSVSIPTVCTIQGNVKNTSISAVHIDPSVIHNQVQQTSLSGTDEILLWNALTKNLRRVTLQDLQVGLYGGSNAPLQIVQAVNDNATTYLQPGSYPSPWVDIPLLQLTLTRRDLTMSSKMRIQTMINASHNSTYHPPLFRILRTANGIDTVIGLPPAAGTRQRGIASGPADYNYYNTYTVPIDYIDDLTGVNASIITYKIQWMLAYTGYAVLNRGAYYSSGTDVDTYYTTRTISTMTVTELKG